MIVSTMKNRIQIKELKTDGGEQVESYFLQDNQGLNLSGDI